MLEDRFINPVIESARVLNVNINEWSVDVATKRSEKTYFDIQVMTPYFHFANGEGIYVMPEVGSMVWVCKPSEGRMSSAFVLGFQAPYDEDNDSYRCRRQNLNPGDIMMRTRDENFLILRRGGVVQIGSTPTAQRIYVPIQNFIRDFCESYQMFTFGGELTWIVERTDQTVTGDAPTKFSLRAKEKANDPEFIADLTIGSHGEGDKTTLDLVVRDSGLTGAQLKARMTITKEGDVAWEIKKDYTIQVDGEYDLDVGKSISMKAGEEVKAEAGTNMELKAGSVLKSSAGASSELTSPSHKLKCPDINLGDVGGQPAAKAPPVSGALSALAASVDSLVGGAATVAIQPFLPQIPSVTTKVK